MTHEAELGFRLNKYHVRILFFLYSYAYGFQFRSNKKKTVQFCVTSRDVTHIPLKGTFENSIFDRIQYKIRVRFEIEKMALLSKLSKRFLTFFCMHFSDKFFKFSILNMTTVASPL